MPNKIIVENGYIIATAAAPNGTDKDAPSVEQMLCHQPAAPSGYVYLLRADTREWELVELTPEPDPGEADVDASEIEAALNSIL